MVNIAFCGHGDDFMLMLAEDVHMAPSHKQHERGSNLDLERRNRTYPPTRHGGSLKPPRILGFTTAPGFAPVDFNTSTNATLTQIRSPARQVAGPCTTFYKFTRHVCPLATSFCFNAAHLAHCSRIYETRKLTHTHTQGLAHRVETPCPKTTRQLWHLALHSLGKAYHV